MQESTLSAVVASEHDLQIMLLDENKRERRAEREEGDCGDAVEKMERSEE